MNATTHLYNAGCWIASRETLRGTNKEKDRDSRGPTYVVLDWAIRDDKELARGDITKFTAKDDVQRHGCHEH